MSRSIVAALFAAALLVGPAAPASAQPLLYTTAPGSTYSTFLPPVIVTPVGGEVTYLNLDIFAHDVVSKALRTDAPEWCHNVNTEPCPLFGSALIYIGQQSPVWGLGDLQSGKTYDYYCSIHPNMAGVLVAL